MVMEVARHKRGDVREDGFIFRHYYISKGRTYEQWYSPGFLEKQRVKFEEDKKRRKKIKEEKKKKQRVGLKYGDIREDGFIFSAYSKNKYGKYEHWSSPEAWEKMRIYNEGRKERIKEIGKKHREKYKEKEKERKKSEHYRQTQSEWNKRNIDKCREYRLRARNKNPQKERALKAQHRARKRSQIPESINSKIVQTIYEMSVRISACTGINHHVDHIIPLAKGGLHHQGNLQILPASINCRKGAKLDFKI